MEIRASDVLSLIYPRRCPICDDVVGPVEIRGGRIRISGPAHRKCMKKVQLVRGATCFKCGKPLADDSTEEYCEDCKHTHHYFTRGFSVFTYRSISGSIYRFKYLGRQEYALFYALATRHLLGKKLFSLGIDAVVPVPMYPAKERKRGYNQARVFAEKVCKELGLSFYPDLIRRVRDTRPMKELDAHERRINLKKAFIISENDVKFKCILIIDDIYTTGSTIDEIAHEFLMAGAERVYCLTLAIGQTT